MLTLINKALDTHSVQPEKGTLLLYIANAKSELALDKLLYIDITGWEAWFKPSLTFLPQVRTKTY